MHEFYLTQENGENDDVTNENEFARMELKEKENNQRRERTKQSYNKVFEETSIDELQVGANDFLLSENNSNVKYGASAKPLTHSSQTERNFSSTVEIDFNQSNSTCTNNENFASKTQRRSIADETSQEQLTKKTIQYYSEGSWISKMIVTYYLNERKVTEEVSGNGERVNISASATNVEVRFKVMRPFWGDVMTYDRFNKTWLKPYTPHIFRYQKAKNRTFTLSGNLRWEAVMGVSNEYGETKEMGFISTDEIYCPQRNSTCSNNENFASKTQQHSILDDISQEQLTRKTIKYYSKGSWISKMIVTYYLNERKVAEEVSGDGKRVNISSRATNIEVRFKVMRPIWGDVMKYDRFTNTWSKPYTPHIFRYEKATGRTFTLSGNLWWEAVMRVTDEYHEETNEMGEV
ncbi:uncharacterized protein LOC124449676 isoform X1 [Xenia sp. Carnegie-2017]|uniref:uncharacterized protein LOC124449676 isoform X1 n=1 Tax=Xenia sp. Carnegie-2017 TaxID=2897299 RepID=UPI001F044C6C|nr:uncharacterized protein LOC124449676 isoform X1 [Xenia sp. Carnegie-2017]